MPKILNPEKGICPIVQLSKCPNVQFFHHHRANYLYTFLQVTETKGFIRRLQRRRRFQVNLQVRYNKGDKGLGA